VDLFNFTSDRASIPVDVVIKHPVTGADTDNVIQIIGLDSPAAQNCIDAQQSKRFKTMSSVNGEVVMPDFDPQEARDQHIELLVACTTGWKNLKWKGEDLPFTPANARMVYEKVPVIRDQVSKATGSRKLFFTD
jgi:hypothetical protein